MPKGVYTRTQEHLEKSRQIFINYNKTHLVRSVESNLKRSQTEKGRNPWNTGLTKETDIRVARMAECCKVPKPNYPEHIKMPEEVCEAARQRIIKLNKSDAGRERVREQLVNGHAVYMNSCIKNPSKPQVEIYNLAKSIYEDAKINYTCKNYSIDIAIPSLKIAIEYDGSFWHKNKEKDEKRQREIELEGWKFIRYIDYIPTEENLVRDVNSRYSC